jgi:hypothetical protein
MGWCLALRVPRRRLHTLSDPLIADLYWRSQGLCRGRGTILLQPSLKRRGILEPSSAPLGVTQIMWLDNTDKGREAFSEVRIAPVQHL